MTESGAAPTGSARAFLSYTRLDDEFFGGAITSLRRLFELGVQVVTGDRSFEIFQDIDGIELGQKWQKRINEAILGSSFLIPIITPLFFTSAPCRDELDKFIEHEKSLGADDRILPIYFQTTPNLEKPQLLQDDSLAREIASRQLYDWRAQADLPTTDPQIRTAVRELATSIGSVLPRITDAPVHPNRPRPQGSAAEVSELVKNLQSGNEAARNHNVVLWVDDRPDNNIIERRSMGSYNIEFVLATSSGQALAELRKQQFDAIISDMGRPGDSRAGYTLLEALRHSGDQTPYFFYTSRRGAEHVDEALERGAQGITYRGDKLLEMLLRVLQT